MTSTEIAVGKKGQSLEHPGMSAEKNGSQKPVMELVCKLCEELKRREIHYCHWKSNEAIDRSASGDNDLDLLIDRADTAIFNEILFSLGFKEAFCPDDKEVPGIVSYFGLDRPTGRILHVHAHYNLVLGNDFSKNFHLPIEKAYLASSTRQGLFPLPAPEMEFIVFVVRMILKHSTWDTIFSGSFKLSPSEKRELAYLVERSDPPRIKSYLTQHLPFIEPSLFDACLRAIKPGSPMVQRLKTGEQLQKALSAQARRDRLDDAVLKAFRRAALILRVKLTRRYPKYRSASGGAMIAIVGGDGAGKTTVIEAVYKWLASCYEIRHVHLGKPKWSLTTKLVRAILKVGTMLHLYPYEEAPFQYEKDGVTAPFPGYPSLFRQVLHSRDRWLTYKKARRFATNGGLVICDRFPLYQILQMDGPHADRLTRGIKRNWLVKALVRAENSYYQQMMLPEVLIVLRLDPNIAVTRKPEESAASVFVRSSEVYNANWADVDASLIDSSLSKEEVLSRVKEIIWSSI